MQRASSVQRGGWSVLVALLLVAAPSAAQPKASCTPVAARALTRGQTLSADDIAAGCASPSLVGSVTRRVIAAGEPLREPAVAPPNVIAPNDPVAVVYRDAGLEIRLKGVAANAAPLGGRVTVRVDVRRRLDGVAVAPGVVQVK
jgi:flagellar basal body P-ring formation protein FlgA